MSSLFRRAGGKLLKIIQQITGVDPGGIAGVVQVYAKNSGGTAHLFAVDGDGTAHQLTPAGGGGGATNVFVFQPGGSPGGNVYDDWETLTDACNAIQGRRFIEFDDQFNPVLIPSGTWDMYDVVWIGTPQGFMASSQLVVINLESDTVFPGLREIRRCRVLAGGGAAAISDLDENDILLLTDGTELLDNDEGPVVDLSSLFFKQTTIELRNEARIVDDASEAIVGLDSGFLRVLMDATSGMDANSIAGSGGTLLIETQSPDYSINQTNFSGSIQIRDTTHGYRTTGNVETGDFIATAGTVHFVFPSGPPINATLPSASQVAQGSVIVIKNFTNSSCYINVGNGSDAVDGYSTQVISEPFGFIAVASSGGSWQIVASSNLQPVRDEWEVHQNWLAPNFAAWTSSVVATGTNTAVLLTSVGLGYQGPALRQSVTANADRASKYLPAVAQSPFPHAFYIYEMSFSLDTADLAGTPGLVYQAGFIHDEAVEPSGEDFIKLYKSSASPNWFFRSQGTTNHDVDTGIPVSGNLERFKIVVRGSSFVNADTAELYIDGTLAATITTDFPANDAMSLVFYLKSTGALNKKVDVGPVWLKVRRAPGT